MSLFITFVNEKGNMLIIVLSLQSVEIGRGLNCYGRNYSQLMTSKVSTFDSRFP
jgi:hypothetical protein